MTKLINESTNSDARLGELDFSSIIAVAIHDMKNSLSLLLQSIDNTSDNVEEGNHVAHENINRIRYEASRMNTTLVQILSLYRADNNALPLNVDECFIVDLFEEVIGSNQAYMKSKNIQIHCDVSEDLSWYLDKDLVYLLVHDVLINAIRYGCENIYLQAKLVHIDQFSEQLKITVSDDGCGYPQAMLDISEVQLDHFCISEGRTGLGLFFARLIANAHKNKGASGNIKLANDSVSGGSVFELTLP